MNPLSVLLILGTWGLALALVEPVENWANGSLWGLVFLNLVGISGSIAALWISTS